MAHTIRRCTATALLLALSSLSETVLYAQEKSKTEPTDRTDYSSESYVVEDTAMHWKFEGDGTNTHDFSAIIRIQSNAAVQKLGLLLFAYQNASESIEVEYVRVRKPDGSVVPTPAEEILDMPAKVTQEAPFYTDQREKQVPVKGLGVGDTLEFKCTWRLTKPMIPGQFWLAFQFPRDEVVLNQVVEISVPQERAVKVKSPEFTPSISEEGGRRIYTWKRKNVARKTLPQIELAQLAIRGRLPGPDIQLSSFQSWDELARWYFDVQKERASPTPEIREKAAELTQKAGDNDEKLRAIYRYVSTEFRYIGIAFGAGRYQPHFAGEVLSNRYGDCKDKHTLLGSLLAAVGIPAYPALINSTRFVDQDVPYPEQFDHLITVVPRGNKTIWVDSTPAVAPLGYLQLPLRDKSALVITSDKASKFETTPADPPFPTTWVFKIDAHLDDAGTLEGKVEQEMRGDLEFIVRTSLHDTPRAQWKEVIQKISYATGFGGEVSDVTASLPEATDSPLTFSYVYTRKSYPDWKTHRLVSPAPSIFAQSGAEDGKLPSTIWLGSPGEFRFESRVRLPDGYYPEVPEKADLMRDFAEFHAQYSREGDVLIGKFLTVMKKRDVSGATVGEYNTFAEKVHEERDQYISVGSKVPTRTVQGNIPIFTIEALGLPESSKPAAVEAERSGKSALQKGAVHEAIEDFKRATLADPKFTRAWEWLGQTYLMTKDKEACLDAFRKAVDTAPQEAAPRKELALALTALGKRDEAIRAWQELEKVAPGDTDLPGALGFLLFADGSYHEAVPYLEDAVELRPERRPMHALLGAAYLKDGKDKEASKIFEEFLDGDDGPDSKNAIGYELAVVNERLDDALRYAQEAVHDEEAASREVHLDKLSMADLRHTVNLGAYWDTLGWVHFRLGEYKKAENYLLAARTILESPVISYHLGEVYEKQNRKEDAAHMYRLASAATSGNPDDLQGAFDARKRLEALKISHNSGPPSYDFPGSELSRDRTVALPRIVSDEASAELFVLIGPGPVVEDSRFISGSDKLRAAGKELSKAKLKVKFPDGSSARIVRRAILACYPNSGCTLVLIPTESVTSVN